MSTLLPYFLVCPLVFLAGFIDAVAGGGGLISLPAYLLTGMPVHNCIATNKLSSGMGTMLAAFRYWRSGCMKLWIAGPSALSALAGSAFGARIALMIADTVFKRLMLIILPITALYILRSANIETVRSTYTARKTLLICLVIAFLIGIYDGFYGPGTGTFLLLLLTGFAHLDLDTAAGTTKAVNLASNIAALTVYLSSGKVVLSVGLAAGCFSIAGNYAGTRFYARKRARGVKKMILIVLAIFFIKVGWELFA